ncbi:MAG: hypothetical protein J6S21_05980 [Victivallales bacterium]|nr:hypothetical protein [Victivallales bacterium]
MKKLLKYLSPFAPDQSGAVAAVYECGALTVICDAGGCAGNVCGFDEPRWFTRKSAIFSAALRDMDAILGRDEHLVRKITDAAAALEPAFTAIIGTPIPAVIGTDYRALCRMAAKSSKIPCIAVECNGTQYYDKGVSEAQLRLLREFAEEAQVRRPGSAAILGATPLDLSVCDADALCASLRSEGWQEVICHGMGSGLEGFRNAGAFECSFVASPAGLAAARHLQERFAIPYRPMKHLVPESVLRACEAIDGGKVLIVHQQFAANELRAVLEARGIQADAATWFMLDGEFARPGDTRLKDEDDFAALVTEKGYECIIADGILRHALPQYSGRWINFTHFAVSGELA